MTTIVEMLSPMIGAITWALLHFLWQGGLVALLLALVLGCQRRSSAAARYRTASVALAIMFVLPIITALNYDSLAHSRATLDDRAAALPAAALSTDPSAGSALTRGGIARVESQSTLNGASGRIGVLGPIAMSLAELLEQAQPLRPWFFSAWLLGALALSLLHVGGWRRLNHLRRIGVGPVPEEWALAVEQLSRRLGLPRAIRVLQSSLIEVPTVIGYLSPVMLIPVSAFTGLGTDQLRGIIAHELAHIKRRDYLVNLLQIVAETLLFFHPALWWVSRRIRIERENCCDDMAVAVGEDRLVFASALVNLESLRPLSGNLALRADGGSLRYRIHRLLGVDAMNSTHNRPWLSGIFLASLLIAGAAAISLAVDNPRGADAAGDPATIQLASAEYSAMEKEFAVEGRWESEEIGNVAILNLRTKKRGNRMNVSLGLSGAEKNEFASGPDDFTLRRDAGTLYFTGEWDDERNFEASGRFGFMPDEDFQRKADVRGLKDSEMLILAVHDMGYDYLDSLDDLGYDQPDGDELVALAIHGVSIEFIEGMRELDYKPSLDRCVEWRIHGVDPDFVGEMTEIGIKDLTEDELTAMRIHGVSPEFAREMADAGFESVDADELVSWRIHGVSSHFVHGMHEAGVHGMHEDELTAMRIHGVSVEFVNELDELGYEDLDADDLVSMRIHGVTPRFIRRILEDSSERPSIDELVKMKIHGIRN